jgi:uncharacterized RDD family membrane protein YckC
MEKWSDARELPAFAELFRSLPPPLPSYVDPSHQAARLVPPQLPQQGVLAGAASQARTSALLHPWRRYFARQFDIVLFVFCASFAIGILFPTLVPEGHSGGSDQVFGLLLLIAYIPIEGFLLNAFGTTFGKALYGIKVIKNDGAIAWRAATLRSFYVWLRGLGVGIPIVTLFTLVNAYNKLKANGATTWDSQLGWTITHSEIGAARWLGVAASWIAIVGVWVVLISLGSR